MELETGESYSRRDRLKEALATLAQRGYSRKCEEERKPMVTDVLVKDESTVVQFGKHQLAPYIEDKAAMMVDEDLPYDVLVKDESTVIQFGKNQLAPYIEDKAAMMVDEDLPYDELRQVLDNRMQDDSSFVSEPFDFIAPEIFSEAFDEQETFEAFDHQFPEIISEAFIEQFSESDAELKPPALESFAQSLLDEETDSSDKSESSVSEPAIDESGSCCSIDDSGDAMVLIGEVTFSEDEIEVHLGETSIIVEDIGVIKHMNPTNRNKVAEDDDTSEGTSVSADDSTIDIDVDTDDYDSDASWISEAPLPELFKQLIFQRLTGEITALTGKVYSSDGRDASADTGAWF
jgi:hypothetical protein